MTREEMKTTGTFTVIFLGLPLIFAAPFVQSSLPASLSRIQCTAISSVYPKIQWPVLKLRGGGPKEEPLLCRLKKGGMQFEVMCLPGMVDKYREGAVSMEEVLVSMEMYKDCKTGDRPSSADIEKAFGHSDTNKCIEEVLSKGEFQLSAAERKKKVDDKTRQIITYICGNFMEGGTNKPIPAARVENGIQSIKGLKIDPFRSTDTQALEIVKKLKEMFPIVKNEIAATISVPIALAGAASGVLHSICTVHKESYTDESMICEVGFLSGDHDRFVAELTKVTKGQFDLKFDDMPAPKTEADEGKGKKGGKGKRGK